AAGPGRGNRAQPGRVPSVARGMTAVRIPPVLRTSTGGQKQVQVPGGTVGEVLSGLAVAYPSLAAQVLTPDGDINRFVNVYLNDTDVRHLQALATPVEERD